MCLTAIIQAFLFKSSAKWKRAVWASFFSHIAHMCSVPLIMERSRLNLCWHYLNPTDLNAMWSAVIELFPQICEFFMTFSEEPIQLTRKVIIVLANIMGDNLEPRKNVACNGSNSNGLTSSCTFSRPLIDYLIRIFLFPLPALSSALWMPSGWWSRTLKWLRPQLLGLDGFSSVFVNCQ